MALHKAYGYAGQILRVNLSTNELIEEYPGE
jgi:hypothetical protein